MSRPPRILITYPFPLGRATGGARMTREIARHLGKTGARVTILPVSTSIGRGSFPRPALEDEYLGREFDADLARDGVDVVRVDQHPAHWLLDAGAVRKQVQRILDAEPVDAVLSYYAEGAALPDLLEPLDVPFGVIATWQSYQQALDAPLRSVPKFLWKRITRRTAVEPYRRAKILFATSGYTRDELISVFGVDGDRIRVCPLGVDPSFFGVPMPEAPRPVRRLLFFGRIIPSKGVSDAIEALGQIRREGGPEFELRLVGQGQHEWAEQLAREPAGTGGRRGAEGRAGGRRPGRPPVELRGLRPGLRRGPGRGAAGGRLPGRLGARGGRRRGDRVAGAPGGRGRARRRASGGARGPGGDLPKGARGACSLRSWPHPASSGDRGCRCAARSCAIRCCQ